MSNASAMIGGAAGASASASAAASSGVPLTAEYPVDVLSGQRNPRGIPQMLFFDEDLAAFFTARRAPVRRRGAPDRTHARDRARSSSSRRRSPRRHSLARLCAPLSPRAVAASPSQIDGVLQSLQTMHGKFKLMESALIEQRKRCKANVPDLENSLGVVRMLQRKREELGAPGGGGGGGGAGGEAASFSTYFNLSEQVFAEARVAPAGKCAVWLGANVMIEYDYAEAEAMLATNLEGARRKTVETEEDLLYLKDQLTTTEVNMSRTYNFEVAQRRAAKLAAGGASGGAGGGGAGGASGGGGGSPGKSGVSARITLGGKEVRLPL